jgi:hypothetical protein
MRAPGGLSFAAQNAAGCPSRRHADYVSAATCGTAFQTRSLCPACNDQWEITRCLGCHEVSRHAAWYSTERNIESIGLLDSMISK